ncbi:MAG: hypothetical protein ACXU9C_01695 [Xanthobacteraceae bacterium]
MTQQQLVNMGMALGSLYAVYKFAKDERIKAMALGVAGVVIAKNVPVIKNYV